MDQPQEGAFSNPIPNLTSRIAVDDFTEAVFKGVMRAVDVHAARNDPNALLKNPIIMYGIWLMPQQYAADVLKQAGSVTPGGIG